VTALARFSGFQNTTNQANELDRCQSAILCQENGAVESDTCLLANKVWAETGAEGALDEKDTGTGGRCGGSELAVGGGVHTSCVNNFTFGNSWLVENFNADRLRAVCLLPLFLKVKHSFPGMPPTSFNTTVDAPLVTEAAALDFTAGRAAEAARDAKRICAMKDFILTMRWNVVNEWD
jgi:hypothetical protein